MAAGIMTRFLGAVKIGRLYLAHRKGLTAHAGGGQTNATLLDRTINEIAVVGTVADSAKLPPFEESKLLFVTNDGANAAQIFTWETTGVNIGAVAGSTGVSLAAGKTAIFLGVKSGRWNELLSA